MAVQIITSPAGDRLVVMPEADYDALVEAAEDAHDLRAVDQFKAALAAGEEELVPAAAVQRMLEGEHPIRVWRELRGLRATEVAKQCGVSAAYLSEIETGKKEGSLSVLKAIASALALDLEDLVWTRAGETE